MQTIDSIGKWHFRMHYPEPGTHPLHIAGTNRLHIAHLVTVLKATLANISERLHPAVGMCGEATDKVLFIIGFYFVDHQERIKFSRHKIGDTANIDPIAIHRGFGGKLT